MNKVDEKAKIRGRYLEYIGYRNKKIRSWRRQQEVKGWLFMGMPLVVMSLFVFGSLIVAFFFLSSKGVLNGDLSGVKESSFAHNLSLLGKDPLLKKAILNTLKFTGITLVITMVGGLITASILNVGKGVVGKKLFLTAFFLPQLTSSVAATVVFVGVFKNPLHTSANPDNFLYIAIFSGAWIQLSSTLINFNVAFTNIGETEYEAASLDGAKAFTKFFRVTIPMLKPIIAYQLIMTIGFGMTAFGQSFILLSQHYVSSPDPVILWTVLGYARVIGGVQGLVPSLGLGLIELLLLGTVIFGLTFISNKIQPIGGI